MSFRDFPMEGSYPDFPHHSEINEYLERYAEAFGLKRNIAFETGVEHARRLEGGGWEIQTSDAQTRSFDALVANGHHWDPHLLSGRAPAAAAA